MATNTTAINTTTGAPKNGTLASDDPVIFARFFYTGVVLYVVFNLIMWPSLVLFYKRRHLFPVSNRFPDQVIALNVVMFFWTTSLCFRLISPSDYFCGYVVWLEDTSTVASLVLYAVRILSLWIRFKVTGQQSHKFWNKELTDALKKLTMERTHQNHSFTSSSMSISHTSLSGGESEDELMALSTGASSPRTVETGTSTPRSVGDSDSASWRRQSWFTDRYWLLSPWFLGITVSALLVICYIPFIYFTITIPNMMRSDLFDCPRNFSITYVMAIEWIIVMIAMLYMGIKLLPEVKEALGMKAEIATIIPIAVGIILFGTIVAVLPGLSDSNRDVFPSFSFIIALGNMPIVIVSTLIPALRTYPSLNEKLDGSSCKDCCKRHVRENLEEGEDLGQNRKLTLAEVLAEVESMNFFRKFLEKEFALENLMFYCETLEWKVKADLHDAKAELLAVDIAKKFLLAGSLMEVNVPKRILNEVPLKDLLDSIGPVAPAYGLLAVLANKNSGSNSNAVLQSVMNNQGRILSTEIFDHARHHVFELMERDSYRRFVQSEDYEAMTKARKLSMSKKRRPSKKDPRTNQMRIMKQAPQVPQVPRTNASAFV